MTTKQAYLERQHNELLEELKQKVNYYRDALIEEQKETKRLKNKIIDLNKDISDQDEIIKDMIKEEQRKDGSNYGC
jgi:uncharacterized coiled-coil DUF342 family protein